MEGSKTVSFDLTPITTREEMRAARARRDAALERRCWVVHRDSGPPIATFSEKAADIYREAGVEVEGPFVSTGTVEEERDQ